MNTEILSKLIIHEFLIINEKKQDNERMVISNEIIKKIVIKYLKNMLQFFQYGFIDYKGVIALKLNIKQVEKVNNCQNDVKDCELYEVIESYLNQELIDNQVEQQGPVCAASSVATLSNQLTESKIHSNEVPNSSCYNILSESKIDTNKALEQYAKHYMSIIEETCQFINRNISKMKQAQSRDAIPENDCDPEDLDETNPTYQSDTNQLPQIEEQNANQEDLNVIMNFPVKKKCFKKKKVTKKPKTDLIENKDKEEDEDEEDDDQDKKEEKEEDDNNEEMEQLCILDYPLLDPKQLYESFIANKESSIKLSEWFEQQIPDKNQNLKGPIKAKLKKVRENFRKLSKIDGRISNCSTTPIGTSVWLNCMLFACNDNKTDEMSFRAHKLIGSGGYKIELSKKSLCNSIKLEDAWMELIHQLKQIKKDQTKPNQVMGLHLSNHYALIYGYRIIKLKDSSIPEHQRVRRQILCTRQGQRPKNWIDFDFTYFNDDQKKQKLCLAQTLCLYKGYNIVMVERAMTTGKKKAMINNSKDTFIPHFSKLDYVKSNQVDLSERAQHSVQLEKSEELEQQLIEKGNLLSEVKSI